MHGTRAPILSQSAAPAIRQRGSATSRGRKRTVLWRGVFLIWFAWPALLPLPVESAQPAVITATTEETGLLRWGEYLEDSTGSLSIANVADSHEWKEVGSESVNFGFTPSSYWFRFFVENSTSGTIESFIELNYPMLDYVDCYSPDGTGSYTVSRSGDMLKFDRREIKDRNIMFKVAVRPGLNTFYLRVQTTSSINFAASLLSYDGYRGRIEQEYPIFWAYYGIMIAMLVYNLLIFIMTRNRTYFYYVLFVAAWALFQFTLNGFAFRYLWPDFPWWANKSLPFIIALVAACCGTILRTFMQTKENHPLADRIAVTTIVVPGLIWAGVSFLIPYGIAIRGSTVIALAGSFIMVTMAIILVFRGSRHARFFLLSWLTMLIGIMLYTLKTFGVLSPGFVTNWSIQIGSSATVVLLSGALAQNINVMRRAMIDLNTSLKESETLARERSVYLEKLVSAAKDISSVLLSVTDDLSGMRENFSGLSREQSATSAQLSEKVQEIKGAYASLYRSILSQRDEGERTRELSRTLQKSQESITGDIAAAAEGVSMLSTANNESEQALKNMIEKMQAINEGGESIENFMDIINEITDRINLLSLNAAIEAARAGEHGRGFAVVADEIGKLAAATSQNARQISGRISSILRDISSGTALMNHTKSQLEQTFGMINTISSRTEEVKHLIGGQDSGINQIVSQAGLMEQLSKSIEEATGRQSEALTMTLNAINRMNEIATEVSNAEKRIMEFIDLIRKNSMQLNDLITGV